MTEKPTQADLAGLALAQITATVARLDDMTSRQRRDLVLILANALGDLHAAGIGVPQ